MEGMNSKFRLFVKSQRLKTYEEARNLALDLERCDDTDNNVPFTTGKRRSEIEQLAESMNKLMSFIMKQDSNGRTNERRTERDGEGGSLGCFNCKGNGHLAMDCTAPCKICRGTDMFILIVADTNVETAPATRCW